MSSIDTFRSLSLQVSQDLNRLASLTPGWMDVSPSFDYLRTLSDALRWFDAFKQAVADKDEEAAAYNAEAVQLACHAYCFEHICNDPEEGQAPAKDDPLPYLGKRYCLAAERYGREKKVSAEEAVALLLEDFLTRWEEGTAPEPDEEADLGRPDGFFGEAPYSMWDSVERLCRMAQEVAFCRPLPQDPAASLQYMRLANAFYSDPVLGFCLWTLPNEPEARLCEGGQEAEASLAKKSERELSAQFMRFLASYCSANLLQQERDYYSRTFPAQYDRLVTYTEKTFEYASYASLTFVVEMILRLSLGRLLADDDEAAEEAPSEAQGPRLEELRRSANRFLEYYARSVPTTGEEFSVLNYLWTAGSIMAMYAAFEKAAAETDLPAMEEALKNMEYYDAGFTAGENQPVYETLSPAFAPEEDKLYWLDSDCLKKVAAHAAQTGQDFPTAFTALLEAGLTKIEASRAEIRAQCEEEEELYEEDESGEGIPPLVFEVYALLRDFSYLCPRSRLVESCRSYMYAAAQLGMCYESQNKGFAPAINYYEDMEKAAAEKEKMEAIVARYTAANEAMDWRQREEELYTPLFPALMERLKAETHIRHSGATLTRTIEDLIKEVLNPAPDTDEE